MFFHVRKKHSQNIADDYDKESKKQNGQQKGLKFFMMKKSKCIKKDENEADKR